jgi:hypothetical protein
MSTARENFDSITLEEGRVEASLVRVNSAGTPLRRESAKILGRV